MSPTGGIIRAGCSRPAFIGQFTILRAKMNDEAISPPVLKSPVLSGELVLYSLAFALALVLRLLRLGVAPLSNFEAGWALQALDLAQPMGSQPAYVLLTGLLFRLLGSSNGLARFFPAVTGALLIWLPWIFLQGWQKRVALRPAVRLAGIIMAFGLAFDPGLVAASRLAGGPMPAVSLGLLALALAFAGQPVLAGGLGGLALLCGPALVTGVLGLVLAWGAARALSALGVLTPGGFTLPLAAEAGGVRFWKQALLFGTGLIFLLGTLWLSLPQGLAAFAATLPDYLRGWLSAAEVPALRLPAALALYQPLAVIFGLVGAGRGWWLGRRAASQPAVGGLAQAASLWAALALLLAMLYPARQVVDLAWVLVPLWALAAMELAEHFPITEKYDSWAVSLGLAVLTLVLSALVWLNLLRMGMVQPQWLLFAAVAGGAVAMDAVVVALIALGWSGRAARYGLVWGVNAALALYVFSGMWGASQVRPNGAEELWTIAPQTRQDDLLAATLTGLSLWQTGQSRSLEIVVLWDIPSLRWALRDFGEARYLYQLAADDNPPVVLTVVTDEDQGILARSVNYRGQDFAWHEYPGWEGVLPPNLMRWIGFREAPTTHETLILWARNDLFPGGATANGNVAPAGP